MIIDLIKYLGDKDAYDKAIRFVKKEYLPLEAWELVAYLPSFYKGSGNTTVTVWLDVFSRMAIEHPTNKCLELVKLLCEKLDGYTNPVNPDVVQMFHNRIYAEQVAEEAIKVAEGRSNSLVRIQETIDEYKRTSIKLDRELQDIHEESMLESLSAIKTTGMKWYLDCLNQLLGPLNNEFILLAARPDGGKTTLLANECWHLAKQLPAGKQILWFNNEEHIRKVKLRVIQSYLGQDKDYVLSNLIDCYDEYQKEFGNDKIIFIDDANTISKVEKIIDRYNPGLIIIDQLYKVQGKFEGKNDLEAERFRKLCEWARDIAKHTAPVIASNQLDGSAEGVKYPPMGALYGSKTGAQGEADGILFIGKTPMDGDKRFLYTPKNKLTGSSEMFEALLLKEIARYQTL